MCRNIKILSHFDPPATNEEIRNASIQFVRKISGLATVSSSNEKPVEHAIRAISREVEKLLESLTINGAPRNRDVEIQKARERNKKRFGVKS